MQNITLGLENLEIGELIRELRIDRNVKQNVLFYGLCARKTYFQLENGEVVMDELLSERLFSRLHVQYRLLDIMLDDDNFWQKECRHEIEVQMKRHCLEKAESLLKEYEDRTPKATIHTQYVLAKRAEILFETGQEKSGELFRKALELTMAVAELEERLKGNGVISEEELWLYFRYRTCENPFSMEEYISFLERVEELFLSAQLYAESYFEAAYQYACALWNTEQYTLCREVCEKAITWLKRGVKSFRLSEFYFLDAMAGMNLKHEPEEEQNLFQKCKMAYYIGISFGEEEAAEQIKVQCEEEFGWHITD
ncbi:MAG: hypothetical protein J6K04_00065 [Lachnospiraceae bacterium]|nr:hypothetical protein [Lachnospiraceae bacterium]